MDEPRKKTGKRGRRARARFQRRLARMQAEAATTQNNPSTRPQLTTGAGAGQTPPSGPQMAQDRDGPRGEGEIGAPSQTPPQPAQVALFERLRETRTDARMARRAIFNRWLPKPEHTEAVMTKATAMALEPGAKLHEVVAVTKLHMEAMRQSIADDHHGERMEYHERALQIRTKVGDYIPASGPPININTGGGPAAVSIFLPAKEELHEDLDRLDQP